MEDQNIGVLRKQSWDLLSNIRKRVSNSYVYHCTHNLNRCLKILYKLKSSPCSRNIKQVADLKKRKKKTESHKRPVVTGMLIRYTNVTNVSTPSQTLPHLWASLKSRNYILRKNIYPNLINLNEDHCNQVIQFTNRIYFTWISIYGSLVRNVEMKE